MVKKKAGSTKKEEETAVLEYLTKVNRPYSATDIFNNLHAKYTKGSIAKALDQLVKDESIMSKAYGKSTIYSAIQSLDDVPSEEEVKAMEKSLEELTEKHEALASENKRLDQVLAKTKSEPTTDEAKELLEKAKTENEQLKEKLEKLKSGTVLIPPEKRKRANDDFDTYRQLWKKRRGMFREIFKTVTEHYPGNPSELKEELGIEEDPIPFEQDPLVN
ncbi:Tat binding protein 1-interacting protein-domain-containing protein [Mucor lusitanicus]|uniref:Homologous-pairing protein 2 homolog n=1 Tax=Mucor circinelloides f. lusitanicus TaxID=29924 RepID=A0A8H4BG58_MUCCL|nr:Tat binding protein 1-interacting protein-domain-containing protein [Mucor lusitanicus]